MAKDYYQILGVAKNATADDIKNAYRKLARKHHPDLNPNDKKAHQTFAEINEAKEVLSDPDSRKKYDKYGDNWKQAEQYEQYEKEQAARGAAGGFGGFQGGGNFGNGGNFQGNFSEDDLGDLFGSMFGGGRAKTGGKFRGQDFQAELHITLREAYTTHKRTLTVNGKSLRITIPAGVANEQQIKLKGQGGEGRNGGPAGDLYITFIIEDDVQFKRNGNDLQLTVNLDLYTAVLGGEIMVETLSGKVKLPVKEGTQNGTKVRLKGKGFPVYKEENAFGDLYVTYHVVLPASLTEKQKELFRELSKN